MAVKFNEKNIQLVKDSLNKFGVKNPFLQTGVIVTAGKETGLEFISEYSYRNTSNKRLREIFGSRLSKYSDAELDALKKDNIKFFDIIYGGRLGNTQPGDGWKFRGRGPNQTTGRATYRKLGKELGLDLENNPDLLNDPKIGADVLAKFFSNVFRAGFSTGIFEEKFGIKSPEQVKDAETGTKLAVQANAGLKTNFNNNIVQEGYEKALGYLSLISPFTLAKEVVKKKVV